MLPTEDIAKQLTDFSKRLQHLERLEGTIEWQGGSGRTLQYCTTNGSNAGFAEFTVSCNWPTVFSAVDCAWFALWSDYALSYQHHLQKDFTVNVNGASLRVRGMGGVARKWHINFFAIGTI